MNAGASPAGDRATHERSQKMSPPSVGIPSAVYVIIGSRGEYSDREERVIGYVLAEDEAQRAVLQAEAEISLPGPPHEDTHAWFLPDGEVWEKPQGWVCAAPVGSQWREKPDAAEVALRNESALAEWRKGRIDSDGPMDSYYYEVAPAIQFNQK